MAAVKTTGAYDLSLFEPRASAAPKRQPSGRQTPAPPKLVPKKKKSQAELHAEAVSTARQTLKVLLLSGLLLIFLGAMLYSRVQLDELNHSLEAAQSQLSVAQAESTRLNAEMQARVTLEKVEDYAKNRLGMVKQQSYQVQYVNLAGEDSVVVSQGKQPAGTAGQDGSLSAKIKGIWSYLF